MLRILHPITHLAHILLPVGLPALDVGCILELLRDQPARLVRVGVGGVAREDSGIVHAIVVVGDHLLERAVSAARLIDMRDGISQPASMVALLDQAKQADAENECDQRRREQARIDDAVAGCLFQGTVIDRAQAVQRNGQAALCPLLRRILDLAIRTLTRREIRLGIQRDLVGVERR
jgi:hypothetical protein